MDAKHAERSASLKARQAELNELQEKIDKSGPAGGPRMRPWAWGAIGATALLLGSAGIAFYAQEQRNQAELALAEARHAATMADSRAKREKSLLEADRLNAKIRELEAQLAGARARERLAHLNQLTKRPQLEPPDEREHLDELDVPTSGATGSLVAIAIGGSCVFTVDGRPRGTKSSIRIKVPVGAHTVTCAPSGKAVRTQRVNVKQDKPGIASFRLN